MNRPLCKSLRVLPAAAVLVTAFGCGGGSSPTSPTAPPPSQVAPSPLQLTCPASVEVRAVHAQPATLSFTVPQAQGGSAPVTVACTPAPGVSAPVGETRVTCTATDARQLTASCSFAVRVVAAPVLQRERFLALGDSLTFGVVSRTLRSIPGNNYVAKLQFLLSERYFDQRPTIVNSGVPGERADQVAQRYGDVLRQTNPHVMILLAGANDLAADGARAIPSVVRALESITRDAQGRGVEVILSTLPPQRPGTSRGSTYKEVVELNGQIRNLCNRYRTHCADLYTAMGGDFTPLIGADGLHPTLAGYDLIAETYFDVIVTAFERAPLIPGPTPTSTIR